MTQLSLDVRIHSINHETDQISSFELVDPGGAPLPPFIAGAHINIYIDKNTIRQYSLCNDPRERYRYLIAVLREVHGRGGSSFMHGQLRQGDMLRISAPCNHFPLATDAGRHLLIAGGIGITPMMAMVAELERRGERYMLHYCARSREHTAFRDRLAPLAAEHRVVFHHDGGNPERGLDIALLLQNREQGTHLYYCGPAGLMKAVAAAAAHWPRQAVHYEFFESPDEERVERLPNREFRVRLALSDESYSVPPDKTIVDVLLENGLHVDTSCKEGYCGTCMTRYLEGEPEHRDIILDEKDRETYVLICCARSKTDELVLDL